MIGQDATRVTTWEPAADSLTLNKAADLCLNERNPDLNMTEEEAGVAVSVLDNRVSYKLFKPRQLTSS